MALFKYVLQELKTRHAVVGFADYADIHQDFEDQAMNEKDLNRLMDEMENSNSGGTNDLEGVKLADDLLKGEDADEMTVIVITDGAGVSETKDYVKEMEARGIRVIGIGIGAGTEAVTDVYTDAIQQPDFNNLSREILRVLVRRMMGI